MIKNINIKALIKFTLPVIFTMLFMSFYTMVDGLFVANLINEMALSAINIVFPVISIVLAFGLMLGTGGNAIIATYLGENKKEKAKTKFTNFIIVGIILGCISSIIVFFNIDWFLNILNANSDVYSYSNDYLKYLSLFFPFLVIQIIFQTALVTANKPGLSFVSMLAGGFTNIILDYVLIEIFNLGIKGAAIATGIGYIIPVIIGTVIFLKKSSIIHFVKPKLDFKSIKDACLNGSSEMVGNIATAVTTFLFNISIFKLAGNDGIAAITVIIYAQLLLSSIFMGYSMGIAPVISYNYGEKNFIKLKAIYKNSLKLIIGFSIISMIVAILLSNSIASLFTSVDSNVYALTVEGLRIFSISFLFSGLNIFASAFFTAYSNGKVSAILAFSRTFVFITISLLILPNIIGINGIWLAIPIAELITFFLSIKYISKYKKEYINRIGKSFDSKYNIIAIEREFSSGGREVGKRLAEKLGYGYYDEEIINKIVKEKMEENQIDIKLYSNNYSLTFAKTFQDYKQKINYKTQIQETNIIRELAQKGNSVFIGKCANYILASDKTFNIFIYGSDMNKKITRCISKGENTNKNNLNFSKMINIIDKDRSKYYEGITGTKITDLNNYNLAIDTAKVDIKKAVEMIVNSYE